MAIAEDAKKLMENRIERIMGKIDVHDIDKEEIRKELRSHYYEVVLSKAQSRGSATVEKTDVDAAFAEAEDPEDTAIAYMKSYIDSFDRAGIVSRTVAYLIDCALFVITLGIIVSPFVLLTIMIPDTISVNNLNDVGTMAFIGMIRAVLNIVIGIIGLVIFITYFIVIEARFGYTPGKRLLKLRVLKEDGSRIDYKESIVRNIPKFISQLLLIDALLMLILYPKEKQRVFDKVAGTIVIHTDKKKTENR